MYCHDLAAIFYHHTAKQGRIGTHAHDILIVIVVRNGMNVHRVGKRLALRRGGCGRKLRSLESIIKSQHPKIHERRQYAVDPVVEQVIHLAFREHCHLGHGNFQFVHFERDIIPMEVAAMNDIFAFNIDYRIVIHRIDFILKNLPRIHQGIIYRSENLRHTTQRIVWLNLLFEDLLP